MIAKFLQTLLISAILLGCSSHEELPPPDNPFDPGNPDYVGPIAIIVNGPAEGEIIDTTAVTITWEGNESASEYRYNFDASVWSEWITEMSRSFNYLDEGSHHFEIQAKSINGEEQEGSIQLDFEVNTIVGPAFVFHPYRQRREVGDTITVSVHLLDVERVLALGFDLLFPTDSLRYLDYSEGGISEEWGGQTLSIVDPGQDETVGRLSVAFTAIEGNLLGYTGSINAISLRFVVENPGTFWLYPQHIIIVNPDGQEGHINVSRGTRIDTQ